jgi:hypothetical protein
MLCQLDSFPHTSAKGVRNVVVARAPRAFTRPLSFEQDKRQPIVGCPRAIIGEFPNESSDLARGSSPHRRYKSVACLEIDDKIV